MLIDRYQHFKSKAVFLTNQQAALLRLIIKISTSISSLSRRTSGQNSSSLKSSSTINKALPTTNRNKNPPKNNPTSPKQPHKNPNNNSPKNPNNNPTTFNIFQTFPKRNTPHLVTKNNNNKDDPTHLSNKI